MKAENLQYNNSQNIKICLCGDVMTGRGIDQILPFPSEPSLYEPFVKDAVEYVELARNRNGKIEKPVDFKYIWGDAISVDRFENPDIFIANLETSITLNDRYWEDKGINYRMNPANFQCLIESQIDCCTTANNHVLDWGYEGLEETMETLERNGMLYTGCGRDIDGARRPAIKEVPGKGRVVVLAFGSESSGIPREWAASASKPGIFMIDEYDKNSVDEINEIVACVKKPGDLVVASIHWGGNWGYEISPVQQHFAQELINRAGIDVVFGHSSHHAKAVEFYKNKPILYGCGDFINDYEGISGYEEYRGDISCMYFIQIDKEKKLDEMHIIPMLIKQFKLNRVDSKDIIWLKSMLEKECRKYGIEVNICDNGTIDLRTR